MLAEGRGRLVRFASPMAIASALLELLGDSATASTMGQRAWEYGRNMIWPPVARSYMECFQSAWDYQEGYAPNGWRTRARDAAKAPD